MVDPIYALIMMSAILVGIIVARWTQARLPLAPREKFFIGLGAFCGAMIGAKLPFVLSDWEGFVSGTAWFSNGKTIMCGLVGGYFGVELAKWTLNVRTKTGDSFAVSV
ncbi:MAG TPA: diacylglyceryl transferase, partial [Lacipirellulaceae bacterium]|nr:diacylglyceryl transferase [Lacipirellulaceae bacterium]